MQQKTKTNNNRPAPMEAAEQTVTQSIPSRKTVNRPSSRKATGRSSVTCSKNEVSTSCAWMKSNTNRPKTLILQVQRTANGYSIKEATMLNAVNQHASRQVPVNVRAVTEDINRRGIII